MKHVPADVLRALHERLSEIGKKLAAQSKESLEASDGELGVVEIGPWQFYYRIDLAGRSLVVDPGATIEDWRAQR